MEKSSAEEILKYIIELLLYYLTEFDEISNLKEKLFECGVKSAYVECLEIIQQWDQASENGLDFNIEDRFPV